MNQKATSWLLQEVKKQKVTIKGTLLLCHTNKLRIYTVLGLKYHPSNITINYLDKAVLENSNC